MQANCQLAMPILLFRIRHKGCQGVFLTAMADEDQKTSSGANASFDLMAYYLGWEIVGRLNVGGCSTADDLHEEDLTAAYELGKNL